MKTKPWKKTTARTAILLREEKMPMGMMGYLANFHSHTPKRTQTATPKMMRHRTSAESQGALTPPYCMPKRNMSVPPTMVSEPSQSMALRPSRMGVRGVLTSRKKRRMKKARPSRGRLM